MKKYLASLLSLILALALVFSLVGCGSDDSKDDDEEEEKTSQSQKDEDEDDDMPPIEDSEDDEEETKKPSKKDDYDEDSIDGDWEGTFEGNFGGMDVKCGVEFTFDDGEYEMVISKADIADSIRDLIEEMADEEGLDVDELAEAQGYDDIDEYIDEYMEQIDEDDLTTVGEYEFDGDEFTMDGEDITFDYDGDTLDFELEDVATVELERA